jgi:hypothetical protein
MSSIVLGQFNVGAVFPAGVGDSVLGPGIFASKCSPVGGNRVGAESEPLMMMTSLETLKTSFALEINLFEESVSRGIGTEGSGSDGVTHITQIEFLICHIASAILLGIAHFAESKPVNAITPFKFSRP